MPKSRLAIVLLVAANIFPLVAVFALGWSVFELLALYWAETAIIGALNIVKMIRIRGLRAIPLCVFFAIHFGGFMAGHGFFLIQMFGDDVVGGVNVWATISEVRWQLLALVVSHGYSYFAYFIVGDEGRKRTVEKQMFIPYPRVVVMHVTIIFSGFVVMSTGATEWALVLLVALKIGADVFAHRREHKLSATAESA